jgi:hypothetical protein
MHFTVGSYWFYYNALSPSVRAIADKAYALLQSNPAHPSLQFKPVGKFWSVRVTQNYRALAVKKPDGYYWFWIGTHAEYDRLLTQ